jgi:hypothetical protein
MKQLILILIVITLFACKHQAKYHKNYNLNTLKPLEFIEILRGVNNEGLNNATFEGDFQENFLTKKDIKALIPLIRSKEKCKCYLNVLSSYLPSDTSELGGIALMLIDDFKNKKNPKMRLWHCPKIDEKKLKEIEAWWQNENN